MSQIWKREDDPSWQAHVLTDAVQLVDYDLLPVSAHAAGSRGARAVLVCHRTDETEPVWLVIASGLDGVQVNGERLFGGARVLNDRDSIRLPGQLDAFYFATERLARVEAFPEQAGAYCPRCKLEIRPGEEAVQCPGCSVWQHQTAERACFTYADTCAVCDQSSDLENPRYRWTPEDL
jgi:hypothetical protein